MAGRPPSSTSSPKLSSQAPLSRVCQSTALVQEVLSYSELNYASYPVAFNTFAGCVRMQPASLRTIQVIAFETFKETYPSTVTVRRTFGLYGHQYNVATVLLPDGRRTYIKINYYVKPPPGCTSLLIVTLSDDYSDFTRHTVLLSRVAANPSQDQAMAPCGLTLATLASLFEVACAQLGPHPYDLFGRNCFWMADLLFYSVAKRFGARWLDGGELTPRLPLERFLREECGIVETAIACAVPSRYGLVRVALWVFAVVVRALLVWYYGNGPGRFLMQDDELAEWVEMWLKGDNLDANVPKS
ncbi:hypothetical protein C8Q70DRAFT_1052121 [Cubamyces menziesii]|uniref:Uncharacterized protein n=1 Tax=Trametes cubensis TaxID=1111947 RepID=A0AAD7TKE7_9APHY|nr:hypothetical protein C8Q70DRAFT_1052121 [Cubamyces menziesii]KAJ8463908.1 hypothetical protein ONZ51_g9945 [Trametes cubensis]